MGKSDFTNVPFSIHSTSVWDSKINKDSSHVMYTYSLKPIKNRASQWKPYWLKYIHVLYDLVLDMYFFSFFFVNCLIHESTVAILRHMNFMNLPKALSNHNYHVYFVCTLIQNEISLYIFSRHGLRCPLSNLSTPGQKVSLQLGEGN